jgi:hypothetical protein
VAERRYDNKRGKITAVLNASETSSTIDFDAPPDFPTISGGDYIKLILEPTTSAGPSSKYEVGHLTAYTNGDSSGTILRAQSGTTAVEHDVGATWACGATADDFTPAAIGALDPANDLSDVADADASRYNLKVPTLPACKAVATANVSSLSGATTIDGVSLAAGDRVLLTAQTTGSQNGPWIVQTGAWTRPDEYPAAGVITSRLCPVAGGTTDAGTLWILKSTASITIDTTSSTWSQIGAGGGSLAIGDAVSGATDSTLLAVDSSGDLASGPATDSVVTASSSGGIPAWASRHERREHLRLQHGAHVGLHILGRVG